MRAFLKTSLASMALSLTLLAQTGDALACGGTFCASGPTAMPVDQTGENILFAMDGGYVEAHVQIQYQGAAESFAWIVPMPAVPQVTVGSQPLFQNLLNATVPSYGFNTQFDSCGNIGLGAGGTASFGSGGGAGMSGGSDAGAGPTVVYTKVVGAFEVTVLQGGTAQEVSNWLGTNGYQSIDTAPAILENYVAKGFVFVAVKLFGGADLDEIHPLVFRYQGTEPCVPLELTAVAAVENMGVRAFFLGDDRVYPSNYKHVELNPVRLDWSLRASNYTQVVGRAVDSPVANGKAFVTEYAGPSASVSSGGVYSPSWNSAAFVTLQPESVVDELEQQGLVAHCGGSTLCAYNHPLLLPIMHQYLPVPSGLTDEVFYGCLSCNATFIDANAWNGAAFAADFQTRIVDPGKHAFDLLRRFPFLTRLFTTISPAEMTEDPMFVARPDLTTPVVNTSVLATNRRTCDGQQGMILPDGRNVFYSGTWPTFSSLMPWAERIEEIAATGAPIVLVDNSAAIDDELDKWNRLSSWPPSASGGSGSGSGGTGGRFGTGGTAFADGSSSGSQAGCGCVVPGGAQRGGLALLLAAALLTLSRWRRRMA
jgi:uncharacterized membrane protein YgcG